jgi:hypothetical protein
MSARRGIVAAAVLAVALGAGLAACGGSSGSSSSQGSAPADVSPPGDIPDSQAFVGFTPSIGGYSIDVPEGWARTDLGTGASFTDKLNSILVETSPAAAPPTTASVRADDVPKVEAATDGFGLDTISTVSRPAGDAVLVKYRARSAPDSVTGKRITQDVERYELWHNGTLATITLTSPKGADNVDPWRTVTTSFQWLP